MLSLKDTVRTSRPLMWLNTSALWVLGLLVLEQAPGWVDLLMIVYFTLPFNLWLHGINDIHDYASDLKNERKGSAEGALLPRVLHPALSRSILLWNLPFWGIALLSGSPLALLLLGLFLVLAWAYSAPPIRGKSRPFLDGLFNVGYLLPCLIVLAWHEAATPLWRASLPGMIAFAAWSVASHAFTSIQDIEADRAGGITTIATRLGARGSCCYAMLFYGIAALAASRYGWLWTTLLLPYLLLLLRFIVDGTRERANALYRSFILLNSAMGFVVITTLALRSPDNTFWAATVVFSLVGVVFVALRRTRYEPSPLPA